MIMTETEQPLPETEQPVPPPRRCRTLAWILAAVFALAMIMGTGPGVWLVNEADSILGLPLLYAWGLFWYAVQAVVIVTAFLTVWRQADQEEKSE